MKIILLIFCVAVLLGGCTVTAEDILPASGIETRGIDYPGPPTEHACENFPNGLGWCALCGKFIGDERGDEDDKDTEEAPGNEEEPGEEDGN